VPPSPLESLPINAFLVVVFIVHLAKNLSYHGMLTYALSTAGNIMAPFSVHLKKRRFQTIAETIGTRKLPDPPNQTLEI
jgi:hypothetical protein